MDALTEADRAALAPALGADASLVEAEIAAGRAALLAYGDDSRIVIRLEDRDPQPTELVIVAGAGEGAPDKVGALCRLADRRGWTVRFHTQRPALGRLLAPLGFIESERIYTYGR